MLFKITFEIPICFCPKKVIRGIAYFYTNFEISIFLIKEDHEQTAAFDYYKHRVSISCMADS